MKLYYPKPQHENGTKRQRKLFAYFPIRLDGGVLIWLEYYFVEESFYHGEYGNYWIVIKKYQ